MRMDDLEMFARGLRIAIQVVVMGDGGVTLRFSESGGLASCISYSPPHLVLQNVV